MTKEQNYTRISDLATGMARLIKDRKDIRHLWVPLQLLYVEMAFRKEISSLKESGNAFEYWNQACQLRPEAPKHLKIWIAQALYMFDLIKSTLNDIT